MNTLTLTGISDELQQKLAKRAAANQRSVEEEALCCVRMAIETDEAALNSVSDSRWKEIETSLSEALRETPTAFTEKDREKYRELARGYLHSQKGQPG
jgi:plasmid stability protein